MENYIDVNKSLWNNKVAFHYDSAFYDVPGFLKGKNILNSIELDLLGDIKGKNILHLQCHFGMDSLALARLGAIVTGVDFSEEAIKKATHLKTNANLEADFICCDIYDLPNHLNKEFDIVFTSYGTIGWLPDLDKWATVVSKFLKPNGLFIMADFHPFVWIWDNNFENLAFDYFNTNPIIETLDGTYADKSAPLKSKEIGWNHPISEIINSLSNQQIKIDIFNEFNYSPYDCFNNTFEIAPNKFQIKTFGNNMPIVYAIKAKKMI